MASVSNALGIIIGVPILAITLIVEDELYVKSMHGIPAVGESWLAKRE